MADGRYDYLETGSLISIRESVENITIPSEERKLKMYPLDFEEFAEFMGEDILLEHIRDCWEKKVPLERPMHGRADLPGLCLFAAVALRKLNVNLTESG